MLYLTEMNTALPVLRPALMKRDVSSRLVTTDITMARWPSRRRAHIGAPVGADAIWKAGLLVSK